MRVIFLLLPFLVIISAKKSNGQIRQCHCDELEKCKSDNVEQLEGCQTKCIRKLENKDWDSEEGQKCLMMKKETANEICMKKLFNRTCDSNPGNMLNVNETNEHRRHKHRRHRSVSEETEDSEEDRPSKHKTRDHHKAAFHQFIKDHFGKSGKSFAKCMQSCSHKFQKPANCAKRLKCGTKRLDQDEFDEEKGKCEKLQKNKRYQVCDCLKEAGVKNLDCTFGGRREKDQGKGRDGKTGETEKNKNDDKKNNEDKEITKNDEE